MRIGISQPTFIPWYGYFGLLDYVDEFIFLTDVQFEARSWQQRNYIKFNDEKIFLTVPVLKKKKIIKKFMKLKLIKKITIFKNLLKQLNNLIENPPITRVIPKIFLT